MALTFGDVKKLTSQYAGQGGACDNTRTAELFAIRVLEYLKDNGEWGSIRRFHFKAQRGCITLPPELETPLQVKIDGRVGTVWNQWMTFSSVTSDLEGCEPESYRSLVPQPNPVFTAYPIPQGGSVLGIVGTCKEEAYIIVQGKDITGREIVTTWKGEQVIGEKFTIQKGLMTYGKVMFNEITGIIKDKTKGYVQIWAVNPEIEKAIFLGDFAPYEEKPSYRQVKVIGCSPTNIVDVVVQGRIKLKTSYADNEIVPFDSLNNITFAAQALQAEENSNIQVAGYKGKLVAEQIENASAYKRVSAGTPIATYAPLSGGAVKGIVRTSRRVRY